MCIWGPSEFRHIQPLEPSNNYSYSPHAVLQHLKALDLADRSADSPEWAMIRNNYSSKRYISELSTAGGEGLCLLCPLSCPST